MSAARVELGRRLFYDARLSVTRAQSCGSCHRQEFAFTDGAAQATGTTGEVHPRSSMSLANVAYNPALAWANPTMQSLEQQALVPIPRAFPTVDSVFTIANVARAIASFERTILSMRSPYDRYRHGSDTNAISASAKRGEAFFFSGQKGACFECHGGHRQRILEESRALGPVDCSTALTSCHHERSEGSRCCLTFRSALPRFQTSA